MMKPVKFYKMEGAGNDFVVLDNRDYSFTMDEIIEFTPRLCNRRFGIGADGLLVLKQPEKKGADYTMIYRNADGSDAGMCGNGGRCMALFSSVKGFEPTHTFSVHDHLYHAEVSGTSVSIQFPVQVQPKKITLDEIDFIKADTATEHVIAFMGEEDLKMEDKLVQLGRSIRMHREMNPPGTNVNFVYPESKKSIHVQTYERGVENLTLACGTGALASAIASHDYFNIPDKHWEFEVHMKGGLLKASFDFDSTTKTYTNINLTGPAHFVFEGIINL